MKNVSALLSNHRVCIYPQEGVRPPELLPVHNQMQSSSILCRSCADTHRCCYEFKGTMLCNNQKLAFYTKPPLSLALPFSLPLLTLCSLSLGRVMHINTYVCIYVPYMVAHSIITCYHLEQFWVSAVITVHSKKKLLWTKLIVTLTM